MSGDSDDDWGDDLGGDDSVNLVSKIVNKQDEMRRSAHLDPEPVKMVQNSPTKSDQFSVHSSDPLLHQLNNVTSSISSTLVAVESLRDQLAECYMDTILKKTVLDQQSIVLQSIQTQSRLEQLKLSGNQKRSTLARLQLEHEQLLQSRISVSPQETPQGVQINYSTINSCFMVLLLVFPLIAVFLMARIILSMQF